MSEFRTAILQLIEEELQEYPEFLNEELPAIPSGVLEDRQATRARLAQIARALRERKKLIVAEANHSKRPVERRFLSEAANELTSAITRIESVLTIHDESIARTQKLQKKIAAENNNGQEEKTA